MKTFLKLSLTAIAFLFFSGTFAVTETKAQAPLRDALKRMDAHNKALQTLRANVVMKKFNVQLGEEDIYEGKTIYLPQKGRNAFVRIDWTKPRQESLAVFDKTFQIYVPGLKQMTEGNINKATGSGKSNSALAFMNMSKQELQANYTPKYVGQETLSGGIETFHIELTPIKATNFKIADLWIDKDGMPVMAKITENNNDTTTVLLSSIEKNVTINASVFKIVPPKDTKIIKA